jgi:hypothetical protein
VTRVSSGSNRIIEGRRTTSEGSANDVEGEAEAELVLAVEAGEVVGHSGEHASLGDTKEETNGEGLTEVVDEGHDEGEKAEHEGEDGDELSRADLLAEEVAGNLENHISDVECSL